MPIDDNLAAEATEAVQDVFSQSLTDADWRRADDALTALAAALAGGDESGFRTGILMLDALTKRVANKQGKEPDDPRRPATPIHLDKATKLQQKLTPDRRGPQRS